ANGRKINTSTTIVTVSVASGNATLSGDITERADCGTVNFDGLVITGSGPVTLTFSAPGFTSVTSASFTVAAAPQYDWEGVYKPIYNDRTNVVNAGRAIPVRFSLRGNPGWNIFAAGYPASQKVSCSTGAALGPVESIDIVGNDWSTRSKWDND